MKRLGQRRARYSVGVVALGVVALIAVLAARTDARTSAPTDNLGGKLAPQIVGRAINTGTTVNLHAMRGRFVVVDFFASWCAPCLAEVPALSRFVFEHAHSDHASVLGVDIDDSSANGRAFLARVGATWPAIEDTDAAITEAYGVVNPPRAFIVNPQGRVVATFSSGVSTAGLDEAIRAATERRAL